MWARAWRAMILIAALALLAPVVSASEAPSSSPSLAGPPICSVSGCVQTPERVPSIVWILILGATLIGLRSLRSDR